MSNQLAVTKHFTDFMESGRREANPHNCKWLLLADGTELSIQASDYHYASPRKKLHYSQYTHFEIGFPNREIPEILAYAEQPECPTDTVYGYVPKEIIEEFISKAGGVVDALSQGVLVD